MPSFVWNGVPEIQGVEVTAIVPLSSDYDMWRIVKEEAGCALLGGSEMHSRVKGTEMTGWAVIIVTLLYVMVVLVPIAQAGTSEPPQVKQFRVNGVDLAYIDQGKGVAVVFVHGAAGDWRSWDFMRPYVAENYRFISYSRRYHYPNQWPGDGSDYSFALHATDLEIFIRELNAGPVHLVGNSYAGFVVAIVAIEHPELLRSVTIIEPGIGVLIKDLPEAKDALTERTKAFGLMMEAVKSGDSAKATELLYDYLAGEAGAFKKLPGERKKAFLDNAKTIGPTLSGAVYPMTCEKLGTIKVPTLVACGERTRPFYALSTDALSRCLRPGYKVALVPDGNHVWYAEKPEETRKLLMDWFANH